MPKQDKQYPCDRSVEEAIDDLIFILPYADKFVDELNFLVCTLKKINSTKSLQL